ncbi:MAG: hypothetical protein HGB37_01520 [Candidatus Moranbacteria bacterium]|nr:hypothetical protein [Candidatus Moranbacteria bacterium]
MEKISFSGIILALKAIADAIRALTIATTKAPIQGKLAFANFSSPSGVFSKVTSTATVDSQTGDITVDTTNKRIVINQAGVYFVNFGASIEASTSGSGRAFAIAKNGSQLADCFFSKDAPGRYAGSLSDCFNFVPGDYIEAQIYQDSGAARVVYTPRLSVFKVS